MAVSPTLFGVDHPYAGGGWQERAACRDADIDLFFSLDEDDQRRALEFCQGCPVRRECLEHAVQEREMYGIWGGMQESERRAIIRDLRRREREERDRRKQHDAA